MADPRRGRVPRRGGFTLTELLVVIFIIGLLTGLILTGVMAFKRGSGVRNTQAMFTMIRAAIESYASDWGDFPPGAGGVEGSEDLYAALSSGKFEGPYLRGDYPPAADTDRNGRPELVDHWKRPISYAHYRSYLGEPMADEYRLVSTGLDGKPGTGDDITNWKK
jgi:general secretion pathway protein G